MAKRRKGDAPSNLGKALAAGYQPMFMTGEEITKHANLLDAASWNKTAAGSKKSTKQKNVEKATMARKLKRSIEDTPHMDYKKGELRSLSDLIKEKGFEGHITLYNDKTDEGNRTVNLGQGHHRVATMSHLNPKQFIPINWEDAKDLQRGLLWE